MSDILDDLRNVQKLRGDTYSSYEVIGHVGRAADEIERLRGIVEFCETASRQQREGHQAEIERLKAALREIADHKAARKSYILDIARAALEGK